jgi:light-regulated signal transduction histidine kinase (bacteriophytochrome)
MRSATDQLAAPVAVISNIVGNIRDGHDQLTQKQMEQMTTMIHAQTQLVTDLLDRMLEISSTSTTQFKAQPSDKDTNPKNDSTH